MIKKLISAILVISLCLTVCACASSEAKLEHCEYVCEDEGEPVMFARLQLAKNGQFLLIPSLLSSFHGAGTYSIHGDTLVLDCFDDKQYTFKITDDGLVFDGENSTGYMGSPAGFSDGSVFLVKDSEPISSIFTMSE